MRTLALTVRVLSLWCPMDVQKGKATPPILLQGRSYYVMGEDKPP